MRGVRPFSMHIRKDAEYQEKRCQQHDYVVSRIRHACRHLLRKRLQLISEGRESTEARMFAMRDGEWLN